MSLEEPVSGKNEEPFDLIYKISRIVVSDRYLDEILTLIVGLTAEITQSKICSLMLLDEKGQLLSIKATQSLSEAYRGKPPVRVAGSFSGKAVLTGQPVFTLDVLRENDYQYPDIAKSEGLKSLVVIPLMAKNKAIGVLNCYSTKERAYSEDEIQMLAVIGNQASMAIANASLLAEKKLFEDKLETRNKVERAKAVLMKTKAMSEEDAHRFLQKQSMEKGRSIRDIAESVILSGEL